MWPPPRAGFACSSYRPYAPELNPDEWAWKNVKHDVVGRSTTTGPDDFTAKVLYALGRLAQLPQLVRGFFADPNLRYITA